ncbi:alkaline phosphatase family protein [Synoicihabitans lomoniglobus]|uniref:Alkaline phosphatase family protein n=1 Tax=Synoicihabitans lomoniglobus TaxID=2909285 RepID=A0AAF0CMM1_9BACT|nr:alkaline phosphatase family protein [Opitutaceae bacterium LMO-M01]WED64338.1 alkaline phosphatase family protein [Opitutaceae bacterium LMO-M01]
MIRTGLSLFLFGILSPQVLSAAAPTRPRLVVGIVVDQMRYDYLTRFAEAFGEEGFKRLQREGTQFRSMHYNYVPTSTGPGHAAIWSGAYPAVSGIANNEFFDRELGREVYCVEDDSVSSVGTTAADGQRSPHRLLVTTVGDELKLATNERAQVIAISLKDRASVLPGGHFADAAYWMDVTSGRFVTSSYYAKSLPDWVQAYNEGGRVAELAATPWTLRDAAATYTESLPDDNPFEEPLPGETAPVFPHDIARAIALSSEGDKDHFKPFATSPWGNVAVRELAQAALEHTTLGRDDVPDVLAVSFSSTDYIGHRFGPTSLEVEDTYRRLDDDLAQLLDTIDRTVGLEHTVVFLTSDHGVAFNSAFLRSRGMASARTLNKKTFRTGVEKALTAHYPSVSAASWVLADYKGNVVLDRPAIRAAGEELEEVSEFLRDYLLEQDGVIDVVTAAELAESAAHDGYRALMRRGTHAIRSGDVLTLFTPGSVFGYDRGGASHSQPFSYDTHAPFLISGPGIAAGAEIYERVAITQIAPTISALLKINEPAGAFEGPLPIFER